jgi:ribosomal protein S18 acetylase RimI-like enzyme
MTDDTTIETIRGSEELLDAPRALWLALRDHHHSVAPELGAVREDGDTWTRRRAQYAAWLAEDNGAFLLVARRADQVLAYAFIRPVQRSSTTWAMEHRELDIETLSVSPDARGSGIGARMIALVREEVARGGFGGLQVTAIAQNVDALRFYQREGFAPEFIHLRDTTRKP